MNKLDNAVIWSIIAATIIITIGMVVFGEGTKADVIDWEDTNQHFFKCITNADEHTGLDPITKHNLCMIVEETNLGSVTITNSCNRKWKSLHHGPHCTAADFYFDDYSGTIEEMANQYVNNLYQMVKFLEKVPFLLKNMGIGIYLPFKKKDGKWSSNGLILHVDSRGRPSRWSRIDGAYYSVTEGIKRFREDLGVHHHAYHDLQFLQYQFAELPSGPLPSLRADIGH